MLLRESGKAIGDDVALDVSVGDGRGGDGGVACGEALVRFGEAVTRGTDDADSKDAMVATLRSRQIIPTQVKEKGKELAIPSFLSGGVTAKQIAIFTRQFSVMIDAGLPLVQCLEILGSQQDNKMFAKCILTVRQDVESGQSLSEALKKHPKVFDFAEPSEVIFL